MGKSASTYADCNSEAATVILAAVANYGGEGAGLVVWARLLLAKSMPTIRGPLFKAA